MLKDNIKTIRKSKGLSQEELAIYIYMYNFNTYFHQSSNTKKYLYGMGLQ